MTGEDRGRRLSHGAGMDIQTNRQHVILLIKDQVECDATAANGRARDFTHIRLGQTGIAGSFNR